MDRDTDTTDDGGFRCCDCGGPVSDPEERRCGSCDDERAAEQLTVEEARAGYSAFLAASATSFEDLLDTVWLAEANWRFDDRLALAVRLS